MQNKIVNLQKHKRIYMFGFKKKTRIFYCTRLQLPGIDNSQIISSSPIVRRENSQYHSKVKWVYIDTIREEENKPLKP